MLVPLLNSSKERLPSVYVKCIFMHFENQHENKLLSICVCNARLRGNHMYIWNASYEFFLLAVALNRYPNLTYVVIVVVVDDSDEMLTYGDNNGRNR